jgi:hypothetical protein
VHAKQVIVYVVTDGRRDMMSLERKLQAPIAFFPDTTQHAVRRSNVTAVLATEQSLDSPRYTLAFLRTKDVLARDARRHA